eukprot:3409486-Prymnesium_polylepis.1
MPSAHIFLWNALIGVSDDDRSALSNMPTAKTSARYCRARRPYEIRDRPHHLRPGRRSAAGNG